MNDYVYIVFLDGEYSEDSVASIWDNEKEAREAASKLEKEENEWWTIRKWELNRPDILHSYHSIIDHRKLE